MRRIHLVIALLGLFTMGKLYAQGNSKVFDSKTLQSTILGEERKYSVYLPAGYDESERSYPILYLLHPAGPRGTVPNQQAWIYYGELKQYLDTAIANGEITPMVVVTPDANFGTDRRSYYNDADGKFNFEDFFFKEFMPHVEKTYRVRSEKASRGIVGASAGGGGAVYYALHHPELFAVCGGLSAAIREWQDANMQARYPDVNENKLKEWFKNYDMFTIIRQMSDSEKNQFKLYLTCGDDDALSVNNAAFHAELNKAGFQHEFRIKDGAHDWKYWRKILPDIMTYVSDVFRQ